ncbi:MAG: hypothetical protein ABR524_03170 [Thermoanaerobaculia bacterium]
MAIQLLREVWEKVQPPRALLVPCPHGYPLGRPGDREGQKRVVLAALELLSRGGVKPILEVLPKPDGC